MHVQTKKMGLSRAGLGEALIYIQRGFFDLQRPAFPVQ